LLGGIEMTVAEWIEKLKQFPQDQEVRITDGFNYHFYEGDFDFQLFEDVDGSTFVDIGIGGFDEDEE
jgi:hypothetical protein